jgi:hypothetical protein
MCGLSARNGSVNQGNDVISRHLQIRSDYVRRDTRICFG